MIPTARRLLSSTSAVSVRMKGPKKGSNDPLDVMSLTGPGKEFDFPLTRDTLLKQEKRREFLHYLRLEQFQFNDLVAFRKRFHKPTPSQIIKVRYQHYQGELHPASRKVVVSFSVNDLPLTNEAATHKFKLLAGPRLNSLTDEVKISCELFPTPEMNEKWCSDTLDKMLEQAEDMTDPMTDIPLDTRPTLARLAKQRKSRFVSLKDYPQEWLPVRPTADLRPQLESAASEKVEEVRLEQGKEEGKAPSPTEGSL